MFFRQHFAQKIKFELKSAVNSNRHEDPSVSEKDPPLAWNSPEFYQTAHSTGVARVSFIEHKGKRVLMVDFSFAELDLVKAAAAEYLHVLSMQPANSVLSLIEVEGIPFHPEALKIGTELTDLGQPYSLRTAVSGVSGFRSFMLQTMVKTAKRPVRLFKERSEALEWLIADTSE